MDSFSGVADLKWGVAMGERSLWTVLGEVPDRRGRKGRQYALRSLCAAIVVGNIAGGDAVGANDLRAIFRWGRRLGPEALRAFGIETGKAPCHATYHYFFASLDADALSRVLGRHALGEGGAGHVAIDGKTLRGSRRGDRRALHVLSAFAVDVSAVIGELTVEPDTNEITAALELLKGVPLDGAIVTGDAIFAQRALSRHIRDAGGDYLFTVKDNQTTLRHDIATAFGDASPLGRAAAGLA